MFPVHPDWFKKRQNKRRRRPPTQTDPPPYGRRGGGRGRVGTGLAGGRRRPSAGGFGPGPYAPGRNRNWNDYWNRRRRVGGFRRPGGRGNYGAGNRNLGRYGGGRRDMDPIPRRPVAGGGGMGGMGGAPRPPVAGGGQPGFDWRRWGAGRGGYTDHAFKKKFDAHEKKYGRGSWDRWKSDPSKGKYWKGMPSWMTNSIAWGEGTAAPTWQDMGYKDEDTFNKTWKMGRDGRSLVRANNQQILDAGYGTWWRGRADGGAPKPPLPGTAPHMPGQPTAPPSRPPRRPQPWGAQNTGVPRRSPRRRSRVPYNQRGYGRRFDRFRRGLGRRRPTPPRRLGGGRGGPRPGGGRGRMSGFAHPYGIARRMGYKGTLAEWMQTEDGQKYQRNIDRGIMY